MRRWAYGAVFLVLAASLPLRAGSFVWTGLAFDDNWNTASNWRGGVAPPNDGTADITLGPATNVYGNTTNLHIGTNQNINTLNFTGNLKPYDIWGGDGNTLTIQSGLAYSPSSTVDTLMEGSLNLALAQNQNWNITNGALEIDGSLSGSATLFKQGTGELRLEGYSSSFSGTIILDGGGLLAGTNSALGTGTLGISSGSVPYLATATCNPVTLANPVMLNGATFQTLLQSPLTLSGTVTLTDNTTIEPQTNQPLYLAGTVTETGGSHSLTVNGPGVVALNGTNSYTGGTVVSNGVLIFGAGSSIPTTGLLKSTGDGYIGIATDPGDLQGTFISKFNSATTGTIGLDSAPGSGTNSFSGTIDLSSFGTAARLGSATSALFYGTITPSGTIYSFGGGGGALEVDTRLTGSNSVVVNSPADAPLTLRLNPGTEIPNTYSGGTTATQSAVIFGPGGLPSGGPADLHLGPGGYIGLEDVSDSTLSAYLARFPGNTSQGIIGFDTGPDSDGVTLGNVNLMGFGSPTFYLGTATSATISGTISLTSTASAYRFAGYKGGQFEIDSALGNNMGMATSVIIGDPDVPATANDPTQANSTLSSTVKLFGTNTYTGGTTLYAGTLWVGQSALGTGTLTVQPVNFSHDSSLRPTLKTSATTIANSVVLDTDLNLEGWADTNYTLSGNITGGGALYIKTTSGGAIVLGGSNTFSGGVHVGDADYSESRVIFASDNAAGTGMLTIDYGTAEFSSTHPVIGGLSGSDEADPVYLDYAVHDLTINQNSDSHYYGQIEADGEGNAALVKQGTGTLYLENYNYYRGGTTIAAGALIAGNNSALGPGTITLSGGKLGLENDITLSNNLVLTSGTLGGFGTFDAPNSLTIGANVIIAPGSIDLTSPGTLSFGSNGLTFASGGTYQWQLQSVSTGEGVGWDLVDVEGPLNVTATPSSRFTVKLISLDANGNNGSVADFNSSSAYSWLVAVTTGGGSITNFAANDFNLDTSSFANALGGGTFTLSQGLGDQSNDLFLNFSPVPEPSTYALLSLGLAGLLLRCWRRRR